MGIHGIPKPALPGVDFDLLGPNFYLALVLAALCALLAQRLVRSGLGLQMMAVREDETAARAVGVNTTFAKLAAFTVSSAMAGALGAFYCHYVGSVDPSVFGILVSATTLVMILAGGWGTLWGPVLGAVGLTLLPEWLRAVQDYRMTIYGAALILIILFMPQGVLGVISNLTSRRTAGTVKAREAQSHVA
jgi:branched-chain amino acid transport system permease protein